MYYVYTGADLLVTFKHSLADLEKRQRELTLAEKLFDLPITMHTRLVKAQKELADLTKVYALYKDFTVSKRKAK